LTRFREICSPRLPGSAGTILKTSRLRDNGFLLNPTPLHACNPGPITGEGNWTWLIGGRVPTLVDAGTGDPRHLAAVEEALGSAQLSQVIITHGHSDHASGAPALAARFGGTRFRKMPWGERDDRWSVRWEPIADGMLIEAGDTTLTAVHTPGHSPDHLCFWHDESRTLFCGDLAMEGNTVWIPAHLQGDLADYLKSLDRVLALEPARLLPAHGPVIDDPVALLRSYIEHRREREEQVIAALRAGDTTSEAIVSRVYRGLKESLVPLAKESVTAHLMKLERERRARRDEGLWLIIDP
jgi:glyoxylase-like metal-dependent hydrolase (beta-lactamase superfamily II)